MPLIPQVVLLASLDRAPAVLYNTLFLTLASNEKYLLYSSSSKARGVVWISSNRSRDFRTQSRGQGRFYDTLKWSRCKDLDPGRGWIHCVFVVGSLVQNSTSSSGGVIDPRNLFWLMHFVRGVQGKY